MKSRQERLEWHMADRCKHVIQWCSGKNYSVHHYQFYIFQFLRRKIMNFRFSHLEVSLSIKAICVCCFPNVNFMHKKETVWTHIVCAQVQIQSCHFWVMFVQPCLKTSTASEVLDNMSWSLLLDCCFVWVWFFFLSNWCQWHGLWDWVHPQQVCWHHQAVWCSQHTGRKGCHLERPWQAWEVGWCELHEFQ